MQVDARVDTVIDHQARSGVLVATSEKPEFSQWHDGVRCKKRHGDLQPIGDTTTYTTQKTNILVRIQFSSGCFVIKPLPLARSSSAKEKMAAASTSGVKGSVRCSERAAKGKNHCLFLVGFPSDMNSPSQYLQWCLF